MAKMRKVDWVGWAALILIACIVAGSVLLTEVTPI